jgi:hypothetical protein
MIVVEGATAITSRLPVIRPDRHTKARQVWSARRSSPAYSESADLVSPLPIELLQLNDNCTQVTFFEHFVVRTVCPVKADLAEFMLVHFA